jgi:TubC N-terminal docking domain
MGARELLSDLAVAGISVLAQDDCLVIQPASKLTDAMRAALRDAKPELLAMLRNVAGATEGRALPAIGWTDADITRFLARRARLMRWGWSESVAEQLADRLVRRDREPDDRVCCADCGHYRPSRCGNHRRAGLNAAGVGRDLAMMLQRCPGFVDEALHRKNLYGHRGWPEVAPTSI